eukprot:TRINITY_DN10265_c0_g1_i1.p2 TRINITY_DN10265_c0_g1~~TRINITY_DN10265_c0_g1_i1.p2  ORF type:complete len:110 (+),score=12.21 TRINITY_DN10265_c0_g1_i1:1133-1462(+)
MSQQGATLQAYNSELVKCIEDLRKKREELHAQILAEEEEKLAVQNDLHILTERLTRITDSLNKKYATRTEYDRTIADTEGAYMKILESSQSLLQVLKRDSFTLEDGDRQ